MEEFLLNIQNQIIKNQICELFKQYDVTPAPTKLEWTWTPENDEFGGYDLNLKFSLYAGDELIDLEDYIYDEGMIGDILEHDLWEAIMDYTPDTYKFNEILF